MTGVFGSQPQLCELLALDPHQSSVRRGVVPSFHRWGHGFGEGPVTHTASEQQCGDPNLGLSDVWTSFFSVLPFG